MEQKINVVLTADSQKATSAIDKGTEAVKNFSGAYDKAADSIKTASGTIADSSQSAMEKLSDSAKKQADAIITASNKATSGVKKDTSLWGSFTEGAKKYFNDLLSFQSFVGLGNKIASAWWKVTEAMAGIGKSAKSIGASTEYFQKLKSTSEEIGVSFSSVEDAFKTVNEQAKKARSGNQEAASAFEKIGISISRLRQMSPDQVFQAVTSALYSLGNATYAQDAKFQLLGNSAGELTEHMAELSKAKGSMGGFFEDKDIKNAESLRESVDKLHNAIQRFASLPIVTKSIGWFANRMNESIEEMEYLTGAKEMPKIEGGTWNQVNVPFEYKEKALEYDMLALPAKAREELTDLKKNDPIGYRKKVEEYMENGYGWMEPQFAADGNFRDENGLSPGQRQFAYDHKNRPDGFMNKNAASKPDAGYLKTLKIKRERERTLAELRAIPFAGSEEIASLINAYDQEMGKILAWEIDGLTKDYKAEIRALSVKKQKEANAKEVIRRVDESTKTPLQKQIEKDTAELKELESLAGDDETAKKKVEELRSQKKQEWKKLLQQEQSGSFAMANRNLDAARKTYENARRRLEMADKHVLAMQEAAKEERDAARLAKKNATLSKASAKLANFGFSLKKQSKMEKLDASIASKLSAQESGESVHFTASERRRMKDRQKAEKELKSAEKALAKEKKRQDKEAEAAKEGEAIAAKQEQMASRNLYFQSAKAVSMATQRSHALLERIAKASENSVFVVKQK